MYKLLRDMEAKSRSIDINQYGYRKKMGGKNVFRKIIINKLFIRNKDTRP
jgi:hypothetical protein